ncbi:hypothetical protein EGT74_12140 [Chitinophaga lutea]|uniref:Uncharacterized protein n=1 Tax=Chitinophaga lutea TaxID=2488634 RepID=A0A3N4Q2B9_9BACT|nr:hypothetical protein [Chitinophaga lutea]RPE14216.1 hypothetical protein EGT74_12140 [Chitinophaga lutea]
MDTPFLLFPNLERETPPEKLPAEPESYTESPFRVVGKLNGRQTGTDRKAESFVSVMNELHDDEFNEQLEDLLNEVKDFQERYISRERYMNNEHYTRQLTQNYYKPLVREVDEFLDTMSQQGYEADTSAKDIGEIESFLDEYEFNTADLTEVQEQFLGGLKKLAKKAVGAVGKIKKGIVKVGKFAANLALGPIFNRIKGVMKKFLAGILQKGTNLLPEKYRGIAQTLAGKILPPSLQPAVNIPAAAQAPAEQDSTRDAAENIQDGLNAATAQLLMADNETEWKSLEMELDRVLETGDDNAYEATDNAKDNFVTALNELEDGESPAPAVEEFVTAVTTALKFAVPLVGRERLKGWAVSLVSKLIAPLAGKENSQALSRLLVDKGFAMLNLEAAANTSANTAVAEVVENTIRQIPEFPQYVLEDRQLFERYIVNAFEQSAAAYLPDLLPEQAYNAKPELRESNERSVMWKNEEAEEDGGNKVLSEVIDTEINPYIANEIKTFGGIPLAVFLRDRMGIQVNSTIPVRVHLFESSPRHDLYQIAKKARGVRGLGSGARSAWMQLHPFTSIAAGLLMREPGLGCRKSQCLQKQKSGRGHRYYYLEIDGARPQYFQPLNGRQVLRRHTHLKAQLNFPASHAALTLYLGEHDAQAIAACLRKKNQPEAAQIMLMMAFREGMKHIFSYGKSDYLRIIHPKVLPGNRSGMAIDNVPPVIIRAFGEAVTAWAGKAFIGFLREQAEQFVKAAEDHADGVSLRISFSNPPDMAVLNDAFAGNFSGVKENLFADQPSETVIHASAGYQY